MYFRKHKLYICILYNAYCWDNARVIEIYSCKMTRTRFRDHSGYGLGQWEETLQCDAFSHCPSPYLEWSMRLCCTANTIAADVLAMQGARTSSSIMLLTQFAHNIIQHQNANVVRFVLLHMDIFLFVTIKYVSLKWKVVILTKYSSPTPRKVSFWQNFVKMT